MSTDRRMRGRVDGPAPPRPSAPVNTPPTPSVRRYPTVSDGPWCPTGGKEHGKMYRLATKWYCPSSGHNGLPITAKDGPREPSQSSFTDEDIEVLTSRQSR